MGNRSLFPGVAVPLAFFCTLFFRHRKKSVSAPWDGQSQSAPESARQAPSKRNCFGKVVAHDASRVAFRSPPCTPFGSPPEAIERPIGLQALLPRRSRRVNPHRAGTYACGRTKGLSSGHPRRGSHCRACLIKNMGNPHPFVSLPRFSFCAFIPAKADPVTAHSTESLPAKPCNGSA